jgi:hypothetical protein
VNYFKDYVAGGWLLCSIDRGKKAPIYDSWNTKPIPTDAVEGLDGAGLLHVLSGTCALDIDNLEAARIWLAERGVDIDALLSASDAVRINSGRHGRAKLLYSMKRSLRTFKPKGSGLELRCATAQGDSVQDVLPPSIHPDTKKPYAWLYPEPMIGHWSNLPAIPASLLAVWRGLTAEDSEVESLPPATQRSTIDLTKLKRAAFKHSPDAEYDEWLRVGMQLHDGTGGTQEGFDIWCEWSKGIKRKSYPGDVLLKTHWLSFSSGQGKHIASGAALVSELPADAEDFPIEMAEDDGENTAKELRKIENETRKSKLEKLEKRLAFVYSAERYFDLERQKIIGSDTALEHMFTSWMPAGKRGVRQNPVIVLKQSATKQFVGALGFHPGEKVIFKDRHGDTFANTYKAQLPKPLEPTIGELERITWLFDRIDDPPYREWLLQFFGHVVQFPGVKIKSAPLIWSDVQGNGKTTLLKMIPMLLVGARYSREVTCALLNSDFNDYLLNAWHVNLTEFRAGSRGDRAAIAQKLRAWITDDEIAVHPKGLSAYSMPNHFFTTATSNEDDAAAIDNNDRRWAIHEMHAAQFTEAEQEWVYNDFLLTPRASGVLRHYFLNISLLGFSASAKALETDARRQMVESSKGADLELLTIAWEQQSAPLERDVVLTHEVADYVRKNCAAKPSSDRIGRMLCRPPFSGKSMQFRIKGSKYRGIALRNIERWIGAQGYDIMNEISGNNVDLTT